MYKFRDKIFTYVELRRKVLRVDTYKNKNNNNILKILVKLYTPLYEFRKKEDEELIETPESIIWCNIWIGENLYPDVNIKKGDYIIVYGKLYFKIFNNRIIANLTAKNVKEVDPPNALEGIKEIEYVEDIPF